MSAGLLPVIDPSVTSLSNLLRESRYQLLKSAVKQVREFEESTNTFKTPSLVLKLGHSIRKCAGIHKGEYLQDDILCAKIQEILGFLNVMDVKWATDISSKALRTLSERKWNKPKRLPMADDIRPLSPLQSRGG